MLRPVSFASKDQGLDELAESLRRNPRVRARARGVSIEDLFSLLFSEAAGRVGSR